VSLRGLLPSTDARLHNTSSYLNMLRGTDKPTREPLPYLPLPSPRTGQPPQTASKLEACLKAGRFARTCEIRAPRQPVFDRFDHEAHLLREAFDAINVTAYLNGKPSVPSPVAAGRLASMNIAAICQSTCRDHTKTSFVSELFQNQMSGVHNVLCLTGDSYAGVPKIKQVYDMDSALMLYEARFLREKSQVHFTGQATAQPPRLFLGTAINPFTNPMFVPVARLRQKAAAGADFVQTQAVFDVPRMAAFMEEVCRWNLHRELFILAGVPGVHLPQAIRDRLQSDDDIVHAGLSLARETIDALYDLPGISGVHLMLFGPDHEVLPQLVATLPAQRRDTTVPPAPSAASTIPPEGNTPCPNLLA